MSRARPWLLVAGAVVVVVAATVLASGGGDAEPNLRERTQALAAELRCPVCQNLSVADSPSRLAGEMRAEIAERLAAGRTDQEVRDFFVDRYGEWVLLSPTRRGLNLLPWLVPAAALLVGAALWVVVVRRRPRQRPQVVSEVERRRIDRDLEALEDGA